MLAYHMVNTKAMNYLSHRSHWRHAARALGSGALGVRARDLYLSLPLTRQLLIDALAWLTLSVFCVLASGTIAWLGIFGLIDLLRSESIHVSHALQVTWAVSLGGLAISAGVVAYFVSQAEDEPI